jgi:CheY-like chemotaxis protein
MSPGDHLVITCAACGRRYRFDAGRFGRTGIQVRCRACGAVMRVDPAAPAASPEPIVPAPRRPLALVAERDTSLRDLLAAAAAAAGWEVETCADGHDARARLATRRASLAILNVYLPGVLGVTICAQVKRHPELKSIRVVLVGSQYRRERYVRDPRTLYGADGFLDASLDEADLRREAGALLAAWSAPAPAAAPLRSGDVEDLTRLTRIIAGDIVLYSAGRAEEAMAAGSFMERFDEEIREGEALIAARFPGLPGARDIFHAVLREELAAQAEAAGLSTAALT